MNLFSSSWELYSTLFFGNFFSIPKNILYQRINFSKFVTNIVMYIFIILFIEIYEYIWNKRTISVRNIFFLTF